MESCLGWCFYISCIVNVQSCCPFVFLKFNRPGSEWKHEHASEKMFDALVRENNIKIPADDQEFIKALIFGDGSRTWVSFFEHGC